MRFEILSTSTKQSLLENDGTLQSPSILIVEDDEDDKFILQEGFDDLNYQHTAFYSDALSAIRYLNSIDDEFLPGLIVTDFNLPAINGFQFVKFLKNHVRFLDIPVVVLTTSMSETNKELFFEQGVAKVIIKPIIYDDYKAVAYELKHIIEQPGKD